MANTFDAGGQHVQQEAAHKLNSRQSLQTFTTLDGATVLGSLATHLLEMAPDKASVLDAFSRNFHPSHWSGSLGQTLAPFIALGETLKTHPDPVVATWAAKALASMRQRIEGDRNWDVQHEESFE